MDGKLYERISNFWVFSGKRASILSKNEFVDISKLCINLLYNEEYFFDLQKSGENLKSK